MFRGNVPAKIDEKGRLKVPTPFRAGLGKGACYVTSLEGDCVRVYAMAEWTKVERKLAKVPSTHPAKQKFMDRVNYYGQEASVDNQGRILIHGLLRESASMTGEVAVLGQHTYLEIWNDKLFVERKLKGQTLTREDYESLASFGI
ncbi:MAG: division/cell wall cluster transcriptional repressor MraZ [Acidobacteriota bacterium]